MTDPDVPREGNIDAEAERAARVLADRARALAPPAEDRDDRSLPVVAFEAGPERYGLTMDSVLRVERVGAVARVPGAARGIIGVVSVDGRPCPLVDVAALLGGTAAPGPARRWAIVLGRRSPELALAADTIDLAAVPGGLSGGAPPRLGTTADARVVIDATALLSPPRRDGGDAP